MRSFVAKRFETRPAGLSLDTEALARYADVIDLSIGDTDFTTDKRIIDAAYADALNGYTHYGDPKGDPELVDAVIQAWKEDFGQDIPREEVLVTTSSSIGMAQALLGIVNPGDEVIVLAPYFASYAQQIELAGGVVVEVPTYEENAYRPDEQELRRVITSRTQAIIINTPCNPTGAAYDRDTLEMLAGITKEFDLLVLADEIYTRYLYEGEFIPMRTLPGMAERTVTLNSFSKNFLMTGWRVGVVIAPAELISVFQFISNALTYTAPSISQRAAIRALALRHQIAEEYICKYRDRVFYASECIEKLPYMTLLRPRGTFYLFPGIAKTGMTDGQFCQFLLEKTHILAVPGSVFGKAGQGHFRIACTVSDEKLREAMERLKDLSACF